MHETVLQEILRGRVVSSRGRQTPRGVKRKMSKYPLRPRKRSRAVRGQIKIHILKRKVQLK